MGMALKEDVLEACTKAGTQKPIDLVHLSSVTMGDRALEAEVLAMFAAHIDNYVAVAENCKNSDDVIRAAHTIKGSARSIGAFHLAKIAEMSENSGEFDLNALKREFSRVDDYIAGLK
ncbi:MAG: Hpt domain-containing protein [Pseudomonadota bacterium]